MALADDIRGLRDRTLADFTAVHDYYTDTVVAWDIVLGRIAAGDSFYNRSGTTGTVTTKVELADKVREYVTGHLIESTFQQFLSIFEAFVADLLRLWLAAYPGSLAAKRLEFRTVLAAADRAEVVARVVDHEVNEVTYQTPRELFRYIQSRVGIAGPAADEIDRIAEAKATRDLLVHNRGVVNRTYLARAGPLARFPDGQRVDLPEPHHRDVRSLLRKVAAEVADAAAINAT